MTAWARTVAAARGKEDHFKLKQLQTVVERKAEKLERSAASARAKDWRAALAKGGNAKASPQRKALSRVAFRWVEGIAGWVRDKSGQTSWDDQVSEADPDEAPLEARPRASHRDPH